MRPAQRNDRQPKSPDVRLHVLASAQYGVLTKADLVGLGLSSSAISRRVKAGILAPMRSGVFRLTSSPTSWDQAMYSVVRWLGPQVVASHRAAAYILRLGDIDRPRPEVTLPRSVRRVPGAIIHKSNQMLGSDIRVKSLIPVTEPTRTVIDCCAVLSEKAAERVMDDALHQRLTTVDRLQARIDALGASGRNGIGMAQALLRKRLREGANVESWLSRRLLDLIVRSGLPTPVSLHPIALPSGATIHPDFAYPPFMIAIEADGAEEHATTPGVQKDNWRDNDLQALGWLVLRFTYDDVLNRPAYVISMVREALLARGAIL